jgi:hypothetical protein
VALLRPDVADEPRIPEDLERQPDGVPHQVVGLTALFSVMLAILVGVVFLTGGYLGGVCAAGIALIAIPALVSGLGKKADRERDHVHPSR